MPKNNATNNIFLNQPLVQTATNYTALNTDVIIEVTNTAAIRTITLPAPSAAAATSNVGKFYVIKDVSGGSAANNITIVPASGLIDGSVSLAIATNYGAVQVYSDGTNYYSQAVATPQTSLAPVWTPYPSMTVNGKTFAAGTMPVTATTNPTKGSGAQFVDAAYYIQIGKLLMINWSFRYSTAGSAGSGTYLFSIPTGFTINTTIMPFPATPSTYPFSIGSGVIGVQGVVASNVINATANSTTTFTLTPQNNSASPLSSGYYQFSNVGLYYLGIQVFVAIN